MYPSQWLLLSQSEPQLHYRPLIIFLLPQGPLSTPAATSEAAGILYVQKLVLAASAGYPRRVWKQGLELGPLAAIYRVTLGFVATLAHLAVATYLNHG